MKKTIMTLLACTAISGAAMADYVGADYQVKDRASSSEQHNVYGVTYGKTLGSALYVEGRMEDEVVHDPSKHEGLVQGKMGVNLGSFDKFTPYVAAAVGYKSKSTFNFNYYVVEGGVKYPLLSNLDINANLRLRSPFSEGATGGPDAYRTVEESLGAKLKLGSHHALTAKVAYEHGDRTYHTWGVGYVHSF
jgi:hypothetical protein